MAIPAKRNQIKEKRLDGCVQDGKVVLTVDSFRHLLDCIQAALFLNEARLGEHQMVRDLVNEAWHKGMDIISPLE